MGLKSVSAFEDVIGDIGPQNGSPEPRELSSPWATINLLLLTANQDEGEGEGGHTGWVS